MNRESSYFKRAHLMVRTLPYVATENCFALKGGTAINFFLRDMPRLSVDIDLTYLPIEPRETSLPKISEALKRISTAITKSGLKVQDGRDQTGRIHKLFVSDGESRIKIEPNEVIRGAIHPPELRDLSAAVEEMFETSATIQTLSLPDIYAGKLCAALDRQHPRDLFDVKILLENEGITDSIRRAFVIYLACHDHPMHELIEPTLKDIRTTFDREFVGMTTAPIDLEELITTRDTMIKQLRTGLTIEERQFLISIKEGNPRWDLLDTPGIEKLPALQWKLLNIRKMNRPKHTEHLMKLRDALRI